jgi:hypothetical protein
MSEKELRREWSDPDSFVQDSLPELEWSIESAATEPKRPARLVLGTSDGFIELRDVRVTSHSPTFQPMAEKGNGRVPLTLSEAEWLLARLPEVVARLAEQNRVIEGADEG